MSTDDPTTFADTSTTPGRHVVYPTMTRDVLQSTEELLLYVLCYCIWKNNQPHLQVEEGE